jgi:polyhydroxyalkanoate synthesis regulator phasin
MVQIPLVMINTIKKTLLAGLGAAVITKERLEAGLDELVSQGKLSATDARILARKLARDGRREFKELSGELGDRLNEAALRSAGAAQTRLRELEARLQKFEQEARARRARPADHPHPT